jgi:DNA mismatch repair protein MutL
MPRITVLPDLLVSKIAAGEVVERPASVVRELVENSLDAGATRVEVEVERGGRKLLRVTDNGRGMDREDARLSIERHATSKLSSEEDLSRIGTLGFRGEALPSIAAVSRLAITTAPRGEAGGTALRVDGGEVIDVRDAPARGTVMEVRNLFHNTPARRKFLKRDSTELFHIVDTVTRLALCHPAVAFILRSGGQETVSLPRAADTRERLAQLYGTHFLGGLLEHQARDGGMTLHGFFSDLENLRDTRANQMLFINGRPVRDPAISHAVAGAYEGVIPRDRHPVFFLFLDLDPARVDVNVHPAKREVRFAEKDAVYRFVRGAVAEALRSGHPDGSAAEAPEPTAVSHPASQAGVYPAGVTDPASPASPLAVAETLTLSYRAELPHLYLGDTFVAVADGRGLLLVDHHAVHERVLYERLLRGMRLESRQLLFPRQVSLGPREHHLVLEHREMLGEFGIQVEDFGRDTLAVRALPEAMEQADLAGVLTDAAEEIRTGGRPGRSVRESVAARIACHASVRGEQALSREAVSALLEELDKCADPDHCPHGRPTRIRYSHEDLRKLFRRK